MGIGAASQATKAQKRSQAFTRQMMLKAHQWEVSDLIAAGLNPILSATGGSGPIGGSPAPFASDASSALDVARAGEAVAGTAGKAVSSAKEARAQKSQLKILENQETTSAHEARRVGFAASTQQELEQIAIHDKSSARSNAELLELRLPSARAVGEFDRSTTGKDIAKWSRMIKQAAGPINFSAGVRK